MVIVSGTPPYRRLAFIRNCSAACASRGSMSQPSIVLPCLSTARYRYVHAPFPRIEVSSIRPLTHMGRLRRDKTSAICDAPVIAGGVVQLAPAFFHARCAVARAPRLCQLPTAPPEE